MGDPAVGEHVADERGMGQDSFTIDSGNIGSAH